MGLAEIEKRIVEEAEIEAENINKLAEAEASKIEEEAKTRANVIHEKIMLETEQKAEEEKTAVLVPARLGAKRKILEEKHKILDEVFAGIAPEIREKKEIEIVKWLNLHTL